MRIAYLGIKGLPSQSGAERVVEPVVERLGRRHVITVYCNSRYTPKDTVIPYVSLIRIPTLPGKHMQATSLFILSALHALFKGKYDVVHVHNTEACFVIPILKLRFPVVATSHGQAYARDKWGKVARTLIRANDFAFAWFPKVLTSVSKPLADEYSSRFGKTVHYIPNGVDETPPVDEELASRKLEANGVDGDYLLFAAGRMDPTKGCHLLLQAFNEVVTDLNLVVVGDMSTVPSYSEELRRIGNERVRFIPFVEDKAELFGMVQASRMFIFPSTIEAMSMMLLEVASLGKPIICSDIPANRAAMGETVSYFASGDANALARKLHWSLQHESELVRLAHAAQERVRSMCNWEVIAGSYERLYIKCQSAPRQRGRLLPDV